MGSFVCERGNTYVKAGRLGDVQPATTFPSQFSANSARTNGGKHVWFSESPPYNRIEAECDASVSSPNSSMGRGNKLEKYVF